MSTRQELPLIVDGLVVCEWDRKLFEQMKLGGLSAGVHPGRRPGRHALLGRRAALEANSAPPAFLKISVDAG